MFIIIGSRAFNAYFPGIVEPKDLDLIGTREDFLNFVKARGEDVIGDLAYKGNYKIVARSVEFGLIECELIQNGNSSDLYECFYRAWFEKIPKPAAVWNGFQFYCAPPSMQFSIKLAHIYHPINWEKHILQFSHLNRAMGGSDLVPGITKVRAAETEAHFGKLRTPSLMKANKETFFLDNIEKIRVFDHDEIHRVMAYEWNTPMFRKVQLDPSQVRCYRDMWEKMTYEDKCSCVLEEAFVIALERRMIPYIFIGKQYTNEREALKWTLMRICTTLCSGWFRKFARDNYHYILSRGMSEQSYVQRFLEKFEAGDIIRIDRYKKFE